MSAPARGSAWPGGPRGMTLVELLVTVAVVAVVMSLVAATLGGTLRLFGQGTQRRASQEQARSAAAFVERALRIAGLGVEPALAFDFSVYRGLGATCPNPGTVPPDATCQRDFVDRPDELVFYARDPGYWGDNLGNPALGVQPSPAVQGRAWLLSGVAGTTLTLGMHGGERLLPGQILQVVCAGGTQVTYVTNRSRVPAGGSPSPSNPAAGPVAIAVGAAVPGDPFNQPGPLAGGGCFTDGTARVFAVDRYRFHVQMYRDLDGQPVPYLMLDTGLDRTGAGVADPNNEIPVAEGIEDLQVVYERPSGPPPASGYETDTWVGETPGAVLAGAGFCRRVPLATGTLGGAISCGSPDPPQGGLVLVDFAAAGAANYPAWSYYPFATASAVRQSPDAANIRTVRIALTARALRLDQVKRTGGEPSRRFFNRTTTAGSIAAQGFPALGADDGYERSFDVASVPVRDLLAKGNSYY